VPVDLQDQAEWSPPFPPPRCTNRDPELKLEYATLTLTAVLGKPTSCLAVRLRNESWCNAADPRQDDPAAPIVVLGRPITVGSALVEGFTLALELTGSDGRRYTGKPIAASPTIKWYHVGDLGPSTYVGTCVPINLRAMGVTESGNYEVAVTYTWKEDWKPFGGKKPWSGTLTAKAPLIVERPPSRR
jgi:hypothetical protein